MKIRKKSDRIYKIKQRIKNPVNPVKEIKKNG